MSRWKQLPDSLDPQLRQLVVLLREHKDRSGLSIAALAARTGVSKSSWDRYLNGRVTPPKKAVELLAQACGTQPAPLVELRELAAAREGGGETQEAQGTQEAQEPPERETEPESEPLVTAGAADPQSELGTPTTRVHQPVPWAAIVLTSVTTALAMMIGLLLLAPWENASRAVVDAEGGNRKPYTGPAHPVLGEFVYESGKEYACEVQKDSGDGLLYAGYSRTHTEMIQQDASRWSVVEAQCLLAHHGIAPGVVDGSFGRNTERAARRLQDRARIAVDGIVGPDTWKVLRT
ncbi:helix-turn-helix domain-containing protein [Streptomyces sp. NPDC012600]|uniref:helix-turn-helix domain-containing protein n=1 Tax=Streptomyces sp. NPDC012600 TaxID=3415005 RepID=UPI003C2C6BFE